MLLWWCTVQWLWYMNCRSFIVDHLNCLTEASSQFSSDYSLSCTFFFFLLCFPAVTAPLFETQCSYVEAKLAHFLSWTRGQAGTDVGPFFEYPESEYWAYADYKYIATLFQDQPSMFEVIFCLHTLLDIRSVVSCFLVQKIKQACFNNGRSSFTLLNMNVRHILTRQSLYCGPFEEDSLTTEVSLRM